jgi:hypothetical protein
VTDEIKDAEPIDDEPTEEELAESARLRDALANPSVKNEDADFLRSVALSHEPRAIDEETHRGMVERAVTKMTRKPRGRVIRVAFGSAAGVLALAAAAVLVLGRIGPDLAAPSHPEAQLWRSRSTQPLFDEPFTSAARSAGADSARGGASARIDRIAMAREADLRENRFMQWGVR